MSKPARDLYTSFRAGDKAHFADPPKSSRLRKGIPNEYRTDGVVQGLPTVFRTVDNSQDPDHLARCAILCLLGEEINMSTLQVYWMNRVFHERPECFTFSEWFCQVADEKNGLARMVTRTLAEKDLTVMIRWPITDERRECILAEMRQVARAVGNHREKLRTLLGQDPIGHTALLAGYDFDDSVKYELEGMQDPICKYLDLREMTFYHFTYYDLMKPFTAAQFMLMTRACEHVLLTPQMLRWAGSVPALIGIPARQQDPPTPMPTVSPLDVNEYARVEYHVRCQQRLFFPGLTSLEAHMTIHACEGTYGQMKEDNFYIGGDGI